MCIAARVLNKMSMMTTVRVGKAVGKGYSYNRGPHIFLNRAGFTPSGARSESGPAAGY